MAVIGRNEYVFQAGAEGERKVLELLSRQLSDEWRAICGYKNPAGELDILLVGPFGVMAIEIKNFNGVISCDGDQWWRDKYDRYGNLVERGLAIGDRRGRGPSAQVNSVTQRLQAFLGKRVPIDRVLTAVVFAHDSSRLGKLDSPTVDHVSTIDQFDVRTVFESTQRSTPKCPANTIIQLVIKDHQFYSVRRSRSLGPTNGRDTASAETTE